MGLKNLLGKTQAWDPFLEMILDENILGRFNLFVPPGVRLAPSKLVLAFALRVDMSSLTWGPSFGLST